MNKTQVFPRLSLTFFLLGFPAFLAACPSPALMPLFGEEAEISLLLPPSDALDPSRSSLASARILYQSLLQQDSDTAWSLLSQGTRQALDAKGAAIGRNGRELLERSMLPSANLVPQRVSFASILFLPQLQDLSLNGAQESSLSQNISALGLGERQRQITFVFEDGLWKLEQSQF